MEDSHSLREDGVVTSSGLREEGRLDTCPAVQTEVRTPWVCTDLSARAKVTTVQGGRQEDEKGL